MGPTTARTRPRRELCRAVLLAWLIHGCTQDTLAFAHLDPLIQSLDGSPSGPPIPSTSVHEDCERSLEELPLALSSPFPATIVAATASREGDVVLALTFGHGFDEVQILRHVRAGADGHTDLEALLPPSKAFVSSLSRIRGGQVLVTHHDDRWGRGPVVTAIDLGSRRIRWARPLHDLSSAPRPSYDPEGRRTADLPAPTVLQQVTVHRTFHGADGRYSVLVSHDAGLDLYGFEAHGAFRFRTVLVAHQLTGWNRVRTAEHDGGSLVIALDLAHIARRAFQDLHRFTWTEPKSNAAPSYRRPVVLSISESGKVTSIHDGLGPSGDAIPTEDDPVLRGTPTFVGDRLVWFAEAGARRLMLSLEQGASEPRVVATSPEYRLDLLQSAAAVDGELYVAGRTDSGSGPGTGASAPFPSFLGRVASDGMLPWHCRYAADPSPFTMPGSYVLHPTEVPLLSAHTELDESKGVASESHRLRVYRLRGLGAHGAREREE